MAESEHLIIIMIMLLLSVTGVAMFLNLGAGITPALDVGFGTWNNAWDMMLTLLVRIIIAPLLIIIPLWIAFNIIKEGF